MNRLDADVLVAASMGRYTCITEPGPSIRIFVSENTRGIEAVDEKGGPSFPFLVREKMEHLKPAGVRKVRSVCMGGKR